MGLLDEVGIICFTSREQITQTLFQIFVSERFSEIEI